MKIEDIVVGERYWMTWSNSQPSVVRVKSKDIPEQSVIISYQVGLTKRVMASSLHGPASPRWLEFWKRKPAAVSEVRKTKAEPESVRLPVGKVIEDVPAVELRMLQKAVRECPITTSRDRSLLDACISYVCVNAKSK